MQVVVQVLAQMHQLLCTLAMAVLVEEVTALPAQAILEKQIPEAEVQAAITTAAQAAMAAQELL